MQMSRNYQTTNKKLRAQQLRGEGRQLMRAGFKDSAEQNFEMAEILDPTPREETPHGETAGLRSVRGNREKVSQTQVHAHDVSDVGALSRRAKRSTSRPARARDAA